MLHLDCADAWSQCHDWDWNDESHHLRHKRKTLMKRKRINEKTTGKHKKHRENIRESFHEIDVIHGSTARACGTKILVLLEVAVVPCEVTVVPWWER